MLDPKVMVGRTIQLLNSALGAVALLFLCTISAFVPPAAAQRCDTFPVANSNQCNNSDSCCNGECAKPKTPEECSALAGPCVGISGVAGGCCIVTPRRSGYPCGAGGTCDGKGGCAVESIGQSERGRTASSASSAAAQQYYSSGGSSSDSSESSESTSSQGPCDTGQHECGTTPSGDVQCCNYWEECINTDERGYRCQERCEDGETPCGGGCCEAGKRCDSSGLCMEQCLVGETPCWGDIYHETITCCPQGTSCSQSGFGCGCAAGQKSCLDAPPKTGSECCPSDNACGVDASGDATCVPPGRCDPPCSGETPCCAGNTCMKRAVCRDCPGDAACKIHVCELCAFTCLPKSGECPCPGGATGQCSNFYCHCPSSSSSSSSSRGYSSYGGSSSRY